ncbi:MAG: N-acetylmuramoyl-L-alanine amidase [Elusimicrobia bacterium]|nr:N-acetylmuramoyl-L-alanine amidase [Elusimicrobiota bacterium]
MMRLRRWLALAFLLQLSIPALSEELRDSFSQGRPSIVVLDPGHGGRDLGAVIRGRVEKELDFAIARKLQEQISRTRGLAARMTRAGDAFVPLADRVDRAREAGGDALVSIHFDDARRSRSRGVAVYYYGRFQKIRSRPGERPLPDPPRSQIAASRRLAFRIRESLREQGIQAAVIDRGAFIVLKSPAIPSVLVELGNLRDSAEIGRLFDPVYRENLTLAIARGIEGFLAQTSALAAKR